MKFEMITTISVDSLITEVNFVLEKGGTLVGGPVFGKMNGKEIWAQAVMYPK